ncbi:hypothetical protein GCM10009806_03140 [Microbacterium flavum]
MVDAAEARHEGEGDDAGGRTELADRGEGHGIHSARAPTVLDVRARGKTGCGVIVRLTIVCDTR